MVSSAVPPYINDTYEITVNIVVISHRLGMRSKCKAVAGRLFFQGERRDEQKPDMWIRAGRFLHIYLKHTCATMHKIVVFITNYIG
jgi:hypothetical protein